MVKKHITSLVFFLCLIYFPQQLIAVESIKDIDPQRLIEEIDKNFWSATKFIEGRLIIDNGRRTRTLTMETRMEGVIKSYSNYLSPARERGTKMLKMEQKMWMYTPQTDRKILIAGHLLRQSMMGSDLSYEDMLEDVKLGEAYDASIEKAENFDGHDTVVLLLVARDKTKTYQTRRVWADPLKNIVYKEERYAKSGKILKRVLHKDYEPIEGRLFPRKMIFRDMLKENTSTTYAFDKIKFDVDIPAKYFSLRILKR
jgi:outer membrane lipoprotein-sorting protein